MLRHIDGTAPPLKTDPSYDSWSKIDVIVLQWIYGILSDDLLVRVLEADTTSQHAWDRIKTIFLNNKNSRAATLEPDFTTLTLSSCSSMEEYCQKLKDLADQLTDVDHHVTESRLVLQLVRGLPPSLTPLPFLSINLMSLGTRLAICFSWNNTAILPGSTKLRRRL